jgi:hypothetical protein
MNNVSKLTPAGYFCLDEIQRIIAKLGGSHETCLAVASLANSHSDEGVLEELRHRSRLLPVVRVPNDMPSHEANKRYGEDYGTDWEYSG